MPKLWDPYDIPIIGLAGEPNSGKTMWGLTIDSTTVDFNVKPLTLVWDTEGSSISYVGALNFHRIDLAEIASGESDSCFAMFNHWKASVEDMTPRQYRVCMLDTISEVESGLVTYMRSHPNEFGYTANQFAKSGGLFWGAVKKEWKRLLMLAAQKCETLVLTAHMRAEFKGATPTGKRISAGKDTIMDITSLYMTLIREAKSKAKTVPQKPSGISKWPRGKSRLVRINPETNQPQQLLPPFIQDASPDGIRRYLEHPPDFSNLKVNERAIPDQELNEDDRLAIKAGIASDESTRAQADLSRVELEKEIAGERKATVPVVNQQSQGVVNVEHIERIKELKVKLLASMDLQYAKTLLNNMFHKTKIAELSASELDELDKHLVSLGN